MLNSNRQSHVFMCYQISADGFISGLAAVTKDALDLSSSDVFLLAVCYEATRGAKGGGGGGKSKTKENNNSEAMGLSKEATDRLQKAKRSTVKALSTTSTEDVKRNPNIMSQMINSDSWKGGDLAFQRQRLASNFALHDSDGSGFLGRKEIHQALRESGYLMSSVCFLRPFPFILNRVSQNFYLMNSSRITLMQCLIL